MEYVSPFFSHNATTLAFSSSDFFIPYLTVTLNSIFKNSDKNKNYDIFIFSKDASQENKKYVIDFFKKDNISIRFIDVNHFFKDSKLHTSAHITIETYFRLIIPELLQKFERILFLDSDLIIKSDINELYELDMKGYPIAATEECLFSASLNIAGEAAKKYVRETLGLANNETYFQAGVMLFDAMKFKEMGYSKQLIQMVNDFNYRIMDQDALNQLFNNNYCRFENQWNWPPMQKHMKELNYVEMMSPNIKAKYLSVKNPKIIHYADKNKPWLDANEEMAVIWWNYARGTPFYELILQRLISNTIEEKLEKTKKIENAAAINFYLDYQKNIKKYKKYKFLARITFGKRSRRYQAKRDGAKKILEEIQKSGDVKK